MYCGEGAAPPYYCILGVGTDASDEEIRRAYRKLAMQWHPDKWSRTPSLLGEAKQKFQQIQEAYSVLSDRNKRMVYDAGMYNPQDHDDDDEVEGFADFLDEMVSLMNDSRQEDKNYSIGELQSMFWEMAQDFHIQDLNNSVQDQQQTMYDFQWLCGQSSLYESGSNLWEASAVPNGAPQSSLETFGAHQFCI